MSNSVGAVSVEMTGDSKPVEAAFDRVNAKLGDFEQKSNTAANAAAKVVNRVEELRTKQAQLTQALVAAASATDRDQAKVHALRLELESVTGSLNRLTGAQQVSVGLQQKLAASSAAAVAPARNLGGAVLEASRAFEDMQYGVAGVLNNIPSLVMSLGGSMGLAGVLSLVLVAATQVTKRWPSFGDAAETAVERAGDKISDLRDEIAGLQTDLRALQLGVDAGRLGAGMDLRAQIDEANKVLSKVGGRQRFDILMEVTGGDATKLRGYGDYDFKTRDKYVSPADFEQAKAAVERLDVLTTRLAEMERIDREKKDQRAIDNAVDNANANEQGFQRRADRAAEVLAANEARTRESVYAIGADATAMQALGFGAAAGVLGLMARGQTRPEFAGVEDATPAELDAMGGGGNIDAVLDISADTATADEITRMNDAFASAGEAAIDLRDPLDRFRDAVEAVDWPRVGTDAAAMAASGNLAGAGSALGSMGGTVVGEMIAPGVGGAIGGALGGAIGNLLGGLLEELIDVLGILTPVFDAVTLVVSALAPIFEVVGVALEAVAGVIVALVPIIAAVAEPVAALLLVAVRLVEAFLPLVNILLLGVGVIVAFLEVITIGVQWLDTNFFRPLSSAAANLYNGFVAAYNAFIDFVRTWPGFAEFGIKMNGISTFIEDTIGGFATSLDEIGAVMGETAGATREAGRSMANVPSWYRVPLAEYRASEGAGSKNPIDGLPGRGTTITGPVTFLMTNPDVAEAVRRGLMMRSGSPVSRRRRDEAN